MDKPPGSQLPADLMPTTSPKISSPKSTSTSTSSSTTMPASFTEAEPTWRSLYLILYNFTSAILWAAVLGRALAITGLYGRQHVFAGTDRFVRMVQTGAGLEVVHSLVGRLDLLFWESCVWCWKAWMLRACVGKDGRHTMATDLAEVWRDLPYKLDRLCNQTA